LLSALVFAALDANQEFDSAALFFKQAVNQEKGICHKAIITLDSFHNLKE
jgi:hypothetical protein